MHSIYNSRMMNLCICPSIYVAHTNVATHPFKRMFPKRKDGHQLRIIVMRERPSEKVMPF